MALSKRYLFGFICFLGLTGAVQAQNFTLNIDAGYLLNAAGTAPIQLNGLLQLVASPSGSFSAPSSTSFVTGDNVLVASFPMDYGGSTKGETTNTLAAIPFASLASTYSAANNYTLGVYAITPNEKIQLRFFPTSLYSTSANYNTAAPPDKSFGAVRSDTVEFGTAGGDPTETAWVVPASGSVDLDYLTVSAGGTYANNTAFASNSIPEPSAYGVIGGVLIGMMTMKTWKRRAQ